MKTFIFVLLATILISCKKEVTMHISAKNIVTDQVYPNLNYYVLEYRTGAFEGKYTTIFEGNLDANGEVFLTKKLKKNRAYVIRVQGPENVCYQTPEEISYTYSISEGLNPDFEFKFAECAYLKFRYKNTNCQNASDHIEITRKTNLDDYFGFYNPASYDGCVDYVMEDYAKIPMGWWFFDWKVTKNGITQNFTDTVYISPNEYKYYEINY